MNPWAKKTIRLAREGAYLDKLHEIYPVQPQGRIVPASAIAAVEKAFEKRDCDHLLRTLLSLEKFPYDDSYVAFLRSYPKAIDHNPKTASRICENLFHMGLKEIRAGISQEKKANTRRGPAFSSWARKTFHFVLEPVLLKANFGVCCLDGNDTDVMDFCNKELRAGLQKRPDIVAKAGRKYVIGEAKFLSTLGGNQGRGFDDALAVASNPAEKAYKVSLLDGELWITRVSPVHRWILQGANVPKRARSPQMSR